MSSSTNPPTGKTQKYQFDTDFGDEEELHEPHIPLAEQPVEEIVPAAPPAPQFSEQQLADAQQAGFQTGYQQAVDEAQQNDNAVISILGAEITERMDLLAAGEERRLLAAQEVALRTTIAIIKKIWPNAIQQLGLSTIEATLKQSMESNPDETRIVVRVHDRMLDAIIERLPNLQAQNGFVGKVIVLADPGVQLGDCKVEWADGGMERLSRGLSVQVEHALERILANLSQVSQNEHQRTSS